MQSYVVCVHRARPNPIGPVSGIVEDIESGERHAFRNFNEFRTMLGHSIAKGQQELPDVTPSELDTHDKVAVIG